jgi:Uma2 family endonuclease
MGAVKKLPYGRALTRADLTEMPDDGHRYELIDGVLLVSPAPSRPHQRTVGNLYLALRGACPEELEVLFAPFDVAISDDTVMQPDLLVARRADFTDRDLPVAPLLAVEVLSPSTRRVDLMLKRSRFEAAGCTSFWAVDPIDAELFAWDLHNGVYTEVAGVKGDDVFRAVLPFPLDLMPSQLGLP